MKKFLLLSLLALFALVSCKVDDSSSDNPVPSPVPPGPQPVKKEATLVSESEFFKDGKRNSDWLFVFYLDGDNSLDGNIWNDLNEMEYGLSFFREGDGSAKSGYESARCVVLWDGIKSGSHSDSHIYELGADSDLDLDLTPLTMDISGVEFLKEKEVDMSDYSTLEKFLVWVDGHYSAKKNVLQIADHGCGAGGISKHLMTRTMLEDTTSGVYSVMSTKEFATGLKNAGYGKSKKFDIMLFDICFGSSIEDLYEFRDFARYYIGSPNATPASGFSYYNFFNKLKKGVDAESFGRRLCEVFENDYKKYSAFWNSLAYKCYGTYSPEKDQLAEMNWGSCLSSTISTITMVDLSKIELAADKIDALAGAIKDKKDFRKYLYVDTSRYPIVASSDYLYYPTLDSHIDSPWTFDLGYFATKIYKDENAGEEVKAAAKELIDVLEGTICTSWRASLYTRNGELCLPSNLSSTDTISFYEFLSLKCCGISVSGGSRVNSGLNRNYLKTGSVCSWYESELSFGARSGGWTDLLKSWF